MPCSGCTAIDIEAGAINCESCEVIKVCFNRGYPYDAIVELLGNNGIHLSLSTLKRRLRRLGLKRKGNFLTKMNYVLSSLKKFKAQDDFLGTEGFGMLCV